MGEPIIDENRYLFLKYLFDHSKNNFRFILSDYSDLIKSTQINSAEIKSIEHFLINEGLVENFADNGLTLRITHKGVKMIESMEKHTKNSTISLNDNKKSIFISHINEDKDVASALKELINIGFNNKISVFVSSDLTSIKYGKEWFPQIKDAILSSKFALILCSPISINHPWINFEAGAAHMIDNFVVPLYYGGLTIDELSPLKQLQGLEVKNHTSVMNLFFQIAAEFDIEFKVSEIENHYFFSLSEKERVPSNEFIDVKLTSPSVLDVGEKIEVSITKPSETKISVFRYDVTNHLDPVNIGMLDQPDYSIMFSSATTELQPGDYSLTFETDNGNWKKVNFTLKGRDK